LIIGIKAALPSLSGDEAGDAKKHMLRAGNADAFASGSVGSRTYDDLGVAINAGDFNASDFSSNPTIGMSDDEIKNFCYQILEHGDAEMIARIGDVGASPALFKKIKAQFDLMKSVNDPRIIGTPTNPGIEEKLKVNRKTRGKFKLS
jgi:hypothetical protein